MSRLIIHNNDVYNGLTKDLSDEKVEYINNSLQYKAVVLHEEYSDSEIKTISKFFNDWFKGTYIYGSDAIEVVNSVNEEKKESEFHCGVEESGFHAYNCNDCPNKCEEWHQWDKEFEESKRKKEMKKVKRYMEIICDEDVADDLFSYSSERVDVIRCDADPKVIIEMGGEKYREENKE